MWASMVWGRGGGVHIFKHRYGICISGLLAPAVVLGQALIKKFFPTYYSILIFSKIKYSQLFLNFNGRIWPE